VTLHPDQPLLREWTLATADGHALHVREWGSPRGAPVLVLHGGPGSGAGPLLWRVFDPQRWRVIVPDQRGAGRSTPAGALHANTTAHLLNDITLLRNHLGLAQWAVAGGSWGATLALLAAARAPHTVSALCLRAPFLASNAAIAAFFDGAPPYQFGLSLSKPIQALRQAQGEREFSDHPELVEGQAQGERQENLSRVKSSVLPALHADLHGPDAQAAANAALAWWQWECQQSGIPTGLPPNPAALLQRLRVQSHYLVNDCFLTQPLLEQLQPLRELAITIVHGALDRVCPPAGTQALQSALPHARVQWVQGVGHDAAHPALVAAWMRALASHTACAA
jgi:proline iminopeptidase